MSGECPPVCVPSPPPPRVRGDGVLPVAEEGSLQGCRDPAWRGSLLGCDMGWLEELRGFGEKEAAWVIAVQLDPSWMGSGRFPELTPSFVPRGRFGHRDKVRP